MRRVNYLVSWTERRAGIVVPAGTLRSLRAPSAALCSALALVAALGALQHARLAAASTEGEQTARRIATLAPSVASARRAERELAHMREIALRTARLRDSGTASANAVAAIVNALPDDAWVTSMRRAETGFELQGRGAGIETVGRALATLSATRAGRRGVRLISARDDSAGGVSYAIALEPPR